MSNIESAEKLAEEITSEEEMILNAYKFYWQLNPEISINDVFEKTACRTGVSQSSVCKMIREYKSECA